MRRTRCEDDDEADGEPRWCVRSGGWRRWQLRARSRATVPAGAATTSTRRITVVGTGQVKGTPDVADVSIGVSRAWPDGGEALSTANDRAAKVIAALKDAGVRRRRRADERASIQPSFDDDVDHRLRGVEHRSTPACATSPKAGEILDAAARVAGDEIRLHGIGFTIDDDSELLATARERAVKRARTQAEQLAAAAGVELGDVVSIDEGARGDPVRVARARRGRRAASVPIEPGTQTLSLSATVVYEIR